MYAQVERSKEDKSSAVANTVAQKKSHGKQSVEFVDNRPETMAQIKHQKMNNYIENVKQLVRSAEEIPDEKCTAIAKEAGFTGNVYIRELPPEAHGGIAISKSLHAMCYKTDLWDICVTEETKNKPDELLKPLIWHECGHAINQESKEAGVVYLMELRITLANFGDGGLRTWLNTETDGKKRIHVMLAAVDPGRAGLLIELAPYITATDKK